MRKAVQQEIPCKASSLSDVVKVINRLRDSYESDLKSVKGDHELTLIVQAKIVALGQVLDEIGYADEYVPSKKAAKAQLAAEASCFVQKEEFL